MLNIEKTVSSAFELGNFTARRLGGVATNIAVLSANSAQTVVDLMHFLARQDTYKELRQDNEYLNHKIEHDAITGTFTREGLHAALVEVSKRADVGDFVGFFIDVEGLGDTNNDYSQAMGNHLLRSAGWITKRLFTLSSDIEGLTDVSSLTGRCGGDEFVALLPADQPLNPVVADKIDFSKKVGGTKNITELRASVDISELIPLISKSDNIDSSFAALRDVGIHRIGFRYDIGPMHFSGGTEEDAENILEYFMAQHGSKYRKIKATPSNLAK